MRAEAEGVVVNPLRVARDDLFKGIEAPNLGLFGVGVRGLREGVARVEVVILWWL